MLSCIDACCRTICQSIWPDNCYLLDLEFGMGRKKTRTLLVKLWEVRHKLSFDWPTCKVSWFPVHQSIIQIWILERYLIPSLHYWMADNRIKKVDIRKENAIDTTSSVKKWLGLTWLTTMTMLHYPAVLNIAFLEEFPTKVMLTYIHSQQSPLHEIPWYIGDCLGNWLYGIY